MPSANLASSSSSNMNSLARDQSSYQANGLIRSQQAPPQHQQHRQQQQQASLGPANSSSSSQSSLQKLPASSPPQAFVYSTSSLSAPTPSTNPNGSQQQHQQQLMLQSNHNQHQHQQQQHQQHMQFPPPPPPPPPLVAQAAQSHLPKMEANQMGAFNSLIVPHSQQQQSMIAPTQQQPTQNGLLSSNQNLSQQQQQHQQQQQQTILMSPIMGAKGAQSYSQQQQHYLQQQHQLQQSITHLQQQQQQQQQQQLQIQQTALANGPPSSMSQQTLLASLPPSQIQFGQLGQQQQQVPMTTIMIPAAAAAQIQSASIQIQQAAVQAMAANPNQAQILVFMIPYTIGGGGGGGGVNNSLQQQQQQQQMPPTIPPTPDQQQQQPQVASSNSTLVRQSQSQASILRASQQQQQSMAAAAAAAASVATNNGANHQAGHNHLQSQGVSAASAAIPPSAAPTLQQQQQQQQHHGRALSGLSVGGGQVKQEPEKFYIKANFAYQATKNRMELSFQKGDILHVLDTLQNTEYGHRYWLATRVKQNGKDAEKGLIPDKNKAEEICLERRALEIGEGRAGAGGTLDASSSGVLSASVGRVSFLKRRAAQRSKSLCKDNWDNVVFDIGSFKMPTYERVVFKHPGFSRPVVIFGPLADVAREKLLVDYPGKYSYPAGFEQAHEHPKVIRLKGILEIVEQGKHALLDITPAAVEKLNHVNLAPIVIFMKTDSKSIIKEFRSRAAESLDPNGLNGASSNHSHSNNSNSNSGNNSNNNHNNSSSSNNNNSHGNDDTLRRNDGKSSKKLLEQSLKLEKSWSHVFTATLDLSTMGSEQWYRKLRETIENQQSANVWMSERKSEKKLLANGGQNSSSSNLGGIHTTGANAQHNEMNFQLQSTQSAASSSAAAVAVGAAGLLAANHHHQLNQQSYQQQQHHSFIDSSSVLSDRFNESLNITNSKSTIDLLPDGTYGNRSQMRNAYAHSLAQKLARASSEPKLNGLLSDDHDQDDDDHDNNGGAMLSNHNGNNFQSQHHQTPLHHQFNSHYHHDDGDGDDDDDDDDDDCIKKPFPSEFENSSSVSSSNGPTSYGMGDSSGSHHLTAASYQHHYPHLTAVGQAKSDLGLTRATTQESIYSRNQINANNNNGSSTNCSFGNVGIPAKLNQNSNNNLSGLNANLSHHSSNNNNNNSNYHLLPPMTSDSGGGGGGYLNHNQSMTNIHNTANANGSNVIDLSRNHDTRGSAFQVYSDMNQNNYHYYNLNKI